MLTNYIQAAMRRARYEILPDDGTFYGGIPGFDGVYANADTLEACREELEEVLEEWILLRVSGRYLYGSGADKTQGQPRIGLASQAGVSRSAPQEAGRT